MKKKKKQHGGARRGAGCPKKYGDSDTVVVSFTLPRDVLDALTIKAEAKGVSRSELVTGILKKAIKSWML